MSDEAKAKDGKRRWVYGMAWRELRIRACLREAAMVAHLERRSPLRAEFMMVAGKMFDDVAAELEATAETHPQWPGDDEFAIAITDDSSSALGQGQAGKVQRTDSEIGDALPKGTP